MPDILIGLDETSASERALDQALIEAETSGRPLHAINAWRIAVWAGGTPGMGYSILPPPVDTAGAAGDLVHELLAQGLRRRTSTLPVTATAEALEGEPGRVLVQAASDAGLVVVGSRGHGYVTGALLGSATAYVLHHARCPVMIVPETEGQPDVRPLRVVVGMDGDAHSRSALRWGLDAARRHRCPA
jgi:nucleotide-binding universal stress UspA family protein